MQTQLSRAETYSKRKKSKKIPMAVAAGALTLSLGAGQVYANSLGTDLWGLILQLLGKVNTAAVQKTGQDMQKVESDLKPRIAQIVDEKLNKLQQDIDTHEQTKVGQANSDLNKLVDDIATEIQPELEKEKEKIKKNIDDKVASDQAAIQDALKEQLRNQLQGKIDNYGN